jgi:glutamate/tyrosine decarboxylase-like PLP-dependent enzyme
MVPAGDISEIGDRPAAELGGATLDPSDWSEFRLQAHRMLDDMIDYTETIRERPLWQPMTPELRAGFAGPLPADPSRLEVVHGEFMEKIVPFALGNVHPGFMGWVHGGGTPVGMLAEMLAAGLNANLGGRDHAPIVIERQLAEWMRELFHLPEGASGLCVTGTSAANLLAVIIARDGVLGIEVRREGLAAGGPKLACYGSAAVHGSLGKALDASGVGSDSLRRIATDCRGRIDVDLLAETIRADRASGLIPFLVVGTAGTVDTGAIDDLAALAEICRREGIWFHVDGAFGALAMLAPEIAPRLAGIEQADSIAFDFHKWGQVPYDAGYILVRDGRKHKRAFDSAAAYLQRDTRGMAAGGTWPCDLGLDLSRGFRALKVWFTFKVYGAKALGGVIARTCDLAANLAERVLMTPELELLAAVELNIVCFRYRSENADRLNRQIVIELQECGSVAPSTTTIGGKLAIRAAIVNHRTTRAEIDTLLEQTMIFGHALENAWMPRPECVPGQLLALASR